MSAHERNRTSDKDMRTAGRLLLIFFILLILAAGFLWLDYLLYQQRASGIGHGFFSVHSIKIEGDTRYDQEALVAYSGLSYGQSVFRINKIYAAENLVKNFPYITSVEVDTPQIGEVIIRIKETDTLCGLMLDGGEWLLIGENNRVLHRYTAEDARPCRHLKVIGAVPLSDEVGGIAFDNETLDNIREVIRYSQQYGVTGLSYIDVTSRIDVTANWNHCIDIQLGTMIHTDQKFSMARTIMDRLLEAGDTTVAGTLDMRSYSGDDPDAYTGIFLRNEYRTVK